MGVSSQDQRVKPEDLGRCWGFVLASASEDLEFQDWYFDGQLLKSKYDHTCLDFNFATGNVYMLPCHGEAGQTARGGFGGSV